MRRLLLSVVLTVSLFVPAIPAQANEPVNETNSTQVATIPSSEKPPPVGILTYGRT